MNSHPVRRISIPGSLLAVLAILLLSACQTTDKKRNSFTNLNPNNLYFVGLMVTYNDLCQHYFHIGADTLKLRDLKNEYGQSENFQKGYEKHRNALAGDYATGLTRCDEAMEFIDIAHASMKKRTEAPASKMGRVQKYYMILTWDAVLEKQETFPVMVRQGGGKGIAKATTLVGGKDCQATYDYLKDGTGNWALKCTDGANGTGTIRFREDGNGSEGSGYDSDGNRIEFLIVKELPKPAG